jgi:misacylated tRNA(Ala) deacylase
MEPSKNYYAPMHTAEHILNQTMERMFGCGRSFNSHIEKKKSKCDYRVDRPLNDIEITEIENRVNEIIALNLDVTEEFIDKKHALGNFNLDKLPEDSGDKIRIIHVGEYDACPCIGLHVKNTSEIGKFRILSHDFENGSVRLRFRLE